VLLARPRSTRPLGVGSGEQGRAPDKSLRKSRPFGSGKRRTSPASRWASAGARLTDRGGRCCEWWLGVRSSPEQGITYSSVTVSGGRYWKRHPVKELEALLGEFHEEGCTIQDPPTYYRVACPCGDHMRWIHLTPSDPNYVKNALKWLRRQPCTKKEAP
jgi:hypothetical protein